MTFADHGEMERHHEAVHTPVGGWVCSGCGVGFKSRDALELHRRPVKAGRKMVSSLSV